jgi:hypothetical protein
MGEAFYDEITRMTFCSEAALLHEFLSKELESSQTNLSRCHATLRELKVNDRHYEEEEIIDKNV